MHSMTPLRCWETDGNQLTPSIPWANRGILWTCRSVEGLKSMSCHKSHLTFSHRGMLKEPWRSWVHWVLSNRGLFDKDLSGWYTCRNSALGEHEKGLTRFIRTIKLYTCDWARVRGLCVRGVKNRKALLLLRKNSIQKVITRILLQNGVYLRLKCLQGVVREFGSFTGAGNARSV